MAQSPIYCSVQLYSIKGGFFFQLKVASIHLESLSDPMCPSPPFPLPTASAVAIFL